LIDATSVVFVCSCVMFYYVLHYDLCSQCYYYSHQICDSLFSFRLHFKVTQFVFGVVNRCMYCFMAFYIMVIVMDCFVKFSCSRLAPLDSGHMLNRFTKHLILDISCSCGWQGQLRVMVSV
jgi:hypothetical protein